MATSDLEHKCKELVTTIEDGIDKICNKNRSFFIEFIANKHETNTEEENKTQSKTIERMFQRIKKGKHCTKENLCKLGEIYKFLLDTDEYKKLNVYKPLVDDNFEISILGNNHYKQIKNMAKNMKSNNNL